MNEICFESIVVSTTKGCVSQKMRCGVPQNLRIIFDSKGARKLLLLLPILILCNQNTDFVHAFLSESELHNSIKLESLERSGLRVNLSMVKRA